MNEEIKVATSTLHFPNLVNLEDTHETRLLPWHALGVTQRHLGLCVLLSWILSCPVAIAKV